jgi:SlyX protein
MPSEKIVDNQLIDLQSRLAFQEHAIQELSEVLAGQQRQIEVLQGTVEELNRRLHELSAGAPDASAAEPPPHY